MTLYDEPCGMYEITLATNEIIGVSSMRFLRLPSKVYSPVLDALRPSEGPGPSVWDIRYAG